MPSGAAGFKKVWAVAMRDFRHTVLTKAFLFGVIGVPLLIVLIGGVAVLMLISHKEPALIGKVVVVDASGEVIQAVDLEFERLASGDDASTDAAVQQANDLMEEIAASAGGDGLPSAPSGMGMSSMPIQRGEVALEVEGIVGAAPELPDAVRQRVIDRSIVAAAHVPESVLERWTAEDDQPIPRFTLLVADGVDSDHVGTIERAIARAAVRVRATRAGLDPDDASAMLRPPRSDTSRMTAEGEAKQESRELREIKTQIVPMAFMMLLMISTMATSNHLLMSTIEEKSNKVMEVLLSAVSPLQLMTGKIIGQGLAGLIIVGVYSSLSVLSLVALKQADLVTTAQLVYLGVYFIMGYFMMASANAAIGSAVSDIREANSLVGPLMMLFAVPWILWMPISQAPNGVVATVFSYVPPVIPFVMILRVAAEEPVPAWQIAASIIWGFACTGGMIWMASRVFRVGVLMTGKPPSPLELLRWVRYR